MDTKKINIIVFSGYLLVILVGLVLISINFHTEFPVVIVMTFFGAPVLFTIIPIELLQNEFWMSASRILFFMHYFLLFTTVAGFVLAFFNKYFKLFFVIWNFSILLFICHTTALSIWGNYIGP